MYDAVSRQVGAAIRFQRETKLKVTQSELAERLGLSRPSIANIEAGRQQLTVTQLLNFADALAVSPEELLPRQKRLGPSIPPSATLPASESAELKAWADNLLSSHA